MKLKNILIILLFSFISVSMIHDNFYTLKMVSGTYVYHFPNEIVEGPSQGDKLILKEDGTFESDTWGNGTYSINGSQLDLNYRYEFGEAGFSCCFYRPMFWGQPRINIVKDLGYYFSKIK